MQNLTADQLLHFLAGAEPTDANLKERLDAAFKQLPEGPPKAPQPPEE